MFSKWKIKYNSSKNMQRRIGCFCNNSYICGRHKQFKAIGTSMSHLRKHPKRIIVLAIVIIAVIAVGSSSFLYLNSQPYYRKTQSITIGNLPLESSALIYVADKKVNIIH
jgi:hypothetical protein